MKRNILSLAVSAAILSGCGGGGASGGDTPAPRATPQPSQPTTPAFDISATVVGGTELRSFERFGFSITSNEELDAIQVTQLSGDPALFVTSTATSYKARLPVVYQPQTLSFQIVARSKDGDQDVEVIDVNVNPFDYDSIVLSDESAFSLKEGRTDYKTNDYAILEFPVYSVVERGSYSGKYCYPDPNFCEDNGPAVFLPLLSMATGDFNGDGNEDVAVSTTVYPQFYADGRGRIAVIYGNGDGTMDPNVQEFPAVTPYRIEVQDFNGDGIDDIWVPNGGFDELREDGTAVGMQHAPLFMAFGGKLGMTDASNMINDDYSVREPLTHTGCAGDFTGDGFPDAVGFDAAFINDGTGRLNLVNMREVFSGAGYGGNHTCHIDDLDGDGIGDLIMNTTPGQSVNTIQVMYSSDHPDWTQRQLVGYSFDIFGNDAESVPSGNDIIALDVDGDGDKDVVSAYTRGQPYYRGRKVKIFINRGEKNLVDETDTRFPNQFRAEGTQLEEDLGVGIGEGNLFAVDFNNDGCMDIYDTLAAPTDEWLGVEHYPGIARTLPILNSCEGTFSHMDTSVFPSGIAGHNEVVPLDVGIPVNLDNDGTLDLIVMTEVRGDVDNEIGARALYTVINTQQ